MLYGLPFIIGIGIPFLHHPLQRVVCGIAVFFGAMLGTFSIERTVRPGLQWGHWVRQALAAHLPIFILAVNLVLAILLMPTQFGPRMACVVVVHFTVRYLFLAGIHYRVLRWVGLLRPAGERLRSLVTATAQGMQQPVPSTSEQQSDVAQAWALPLQHELIFTTGLLAICTDEEVGAVVAHEMAHLSESRAILAGRILAWSLPSMLIFIPPMVQWSGPSSAILLLLVYFLAHRAWQHYSKRMEERADRAATASEQDAGAYARALCKIYEADLVPAVNAGKRASHPDLYDRMIAAGVTPDFPRPAKPEHASFVGVACLVLLFIAVLLYQ